mmetsp:Transcript_36989/g.92032  ORF Transcript_36989/g.92032 Transcript_36989/m.92032 type:complete len:195 (+) Transcript_36989:506-1090(+)
MKTAQAAEKIDYVMVPKRWFSDPLRKSMSKLVRPPTMNTRRKQMVLKVHTIEAVFLELMAPLQTGEVEGLKWSADGKSLTPTSTTKALHKYSYLLKKPSLVDKMWKLQEGDLKKSPREKAILLRRGHGAAKLHLSRAAAQRGERTDLISQVTGNVWVELKVPRNLSRMPLLTLKFAVSTALLTPVSLMGRAQKT